jgi:hypothetical protein
MDQGKLRYVSFLTEHGRKDVYAKRMEGGAYVPVHDKLVPLVIERHISGGPSVGQYLVVGDKVQAGVLDLDSHDGVTLWADMVSAAVQIIAAATALGLKAHVFRSGGGHGIHVWFVWEKPQNARYVRHLLRNLLASIGLSDGTGGVSRCEVEIFPKQDTVAPEKLGNLIALPGARQSALLDAKSLDPVTWDSVDLYEVQQRWSTPVPMVVADEQRPAAFVRLVGDDDEVKAALKRVPADDYNTWLRVGLALKHEFEDAGLQIFDEWSATCTAKFPGAAAVDKFWKALKPTGEIGIGTIFHLARANGWNGPSNPIIREMNARFGIFTHGNRTLIIIKNGDRRPDDEFVTLAMQPFLDRLAPENLQLTDDDGKARTVNKAKLWLGHRLADHYYRLDFDPSIPPGHNGRTWNMWTGFGFTPAAGDWSLLKEHIRSNICDKDPEKFGWLMNWMADGVQNRGDALGTAPVLIGTPGTGKGVLAHAYGRLWGSHFVSVTHPEHVIGRFSGHLLAKRFVFIDEGTFGGSRKDAGQLKTRITEPMLMLEQKHVDAFRMRNRLIFIIASNELSVVPADRNDRRWMVLRVSDAERENHTYFAAIQRQLDEGGYSAMLDELLHRDLSQGPSPRRVIKTEALFEQIILAQPADLAYVHMILDHGRLPQNWLEGATVTTIQALFTELRQRYPEARYVSEIRLGRLLHEIFLGIHTAANGRYFVKVGGSGQLIAQRSTKYIFPPLAEARRQFERHIGITAVPWSADVDDWQIDPEPEVPGIADEEEIL